MTSDLSRMDLAELGRHVVTLPRWRWMRGMRTSDGLRLARDNPDPMVTDCDGPDLADPATIGCLLALVREAWGEPRMSTCYDPDDGEALAWGTMWPLHRDGPEFRGPTEAHALVAALEAAPHG